MNPAKYHLITYGCAMNKADSERVASLFESLGLVATDDEKEADVILINSCSVRQSAEDRIFGKLREFNKLRTKRPNLVVGVTGCLPGRDADGKIHAKMPGADLYFPIRELTELPRRLAGLRPDLVAPSGELDADYLKIAPKQHAGHHAFVTIQTGCNKFCTYCVVPYARGREWNRPLRDILAEVRQFVADGVVAVDLLGQAVNAYVIPDPEAVSPANPYKNGFAALLWELNQIEGLQRLGFTSPHPLHMDDEVIDAMALPKMMRFILLPAQAGNDEVLRRMNRRYTAERYLKIVAKLRARVPGICIGTDLIVGFPGETTEQFEDTLKLYSAADFDIAYPAIYSPRTGTVSAKHFPDDVPRAEKKRRWFAIQHLMEETTWRKNQEYVGAEVEVLVDACARGWCSGQTREMKLAKFRCDEPCVGATVHLRVTKAMEWVLEGERI